MDSDADSVFINDRSHGDLPNPLRNERANVNYALDWWASKAKQGSREQPETFWLALETLGRAWMREAKREARPKIKCPHCGWIRIVPASVLVDESTTDVVKGIGEAGTIGATPAVQNAVVDAVAHLGVRHIDMPASPQRVWRAIQAAAGGSGGSSPRNSTRKGA
jgi:hypothetical protein